jgi:hypothetical protein
MINLDSLTVDQLKELPENEVRRHIVIPLLKEIGAENVIDMHGRSEKGIDVYFEWRDVFYHRRRFGIQIKKGDVAYGCPPNRNTNILEICNQIEEGFSKETIMFDSEHGKISVTIDGYYVLVSGRITQDAKDYIYEKRKKYPYIHIIDGHGIIKVLKNKIELKKRISTRLF